MWARPVRAPYLVPQDSAYGRPKEWHAAYPSSTPTAGPQVRTILGIGSAADPFLGMDGRVERSRRGGQNS
jgi:hypothetical protein